MTRTRPANRTVLYVVHNHPSVMPGGAETYALELYEAVRDQTPGWDPVLLAGTGPPGAARGSPHPGTLVEPVGDDPAQYFFHTDAADFDWFLSTARNKELYTHYLANFLRAYRPEVVHVQHSMFFGFDLLRQVRNTLPEAAIIYTLHEYLPMCVRDGQLLRSDDTTCTGPTPRGCATCVPGHSPQDFFLRDRFVKSHLQLVDLFVAPSRFLLERYAAWGIPREKLVYEENGRRAGARTPGQAGRRRTRLGYFGQFTRYKGADVLMEAMALLAERQVDPEIRLTLHGANLQHAPADFQEHFRSLLAEARGPIRLHGRYRPDDLPRLMAEVDWVVMPSLWYENAPLVIQEAFQHGRPVICSDIGGMAEKVRDGVDGLHFRSGDRFSLADTLERAATTPDLWERLAAGIRPVHSLEDHVLTLTRLYEHALATRRGLHSPAARGRRQEPLGAPEECNVVA